MKWKPEILAVLIGVIGLTGGCKSVNQPPPIGRSAASPGGEQNLPLGAERDWK